MSKQFKKIVDTINHLIDVDVTSRINCMRKNFIVVNNLTDYEKVNIERIGCEYKLYRIEKNGVSGTAIISL